MEAWIEILEHIGNIADDDVASFMEAWIEIKLTCHSSSPFFVASFMEAWIEIWFYRNTIPEPPSPPSWRRGLKWVWEEILLIRHVSPPSWRRGLK